MTRDRSSDNPNPAATLRVRAEGLLREKATPSTTAAPRGSVPAIAYELNVHQMELEIQNEDLRQSQVELAEARDRYADLYEFAPVGYVTLDRQGRVLDANLTAATMLTIERQALVGTNVSEFVDRESQDKWYLYRQAVFSTDTKRTCDVDLHTADGTPLAIHLESIAFGSEEERCCRTALIDVTSQRIEEELTYVAYHDSLTGLANRMAFAGHLDHAIRSARRERRSGALLFLDLDRFKYVNDSLGHSVGDKLLAAVAERLSRGVRASDILARLGGDEFAMLVDRIESPEEAVVPAQKLLSLLSEPFRIEGRELAVSASIGIAVFPGDGDESSMLIRNADTAMYVAKSHPHPKYHFYSPELTRWAADFRHLELQLRDGIADDKFEPVYQAIADLRSGRLVGVEAQIQWVGPGQEGASHSAFPEVAVKTGLIVPLGASILKKIASDAKAWTATRDMEARISFNLSTPELRNPGFVDMVYDILDESDLPGTVLELGVTEDFLMDNVTEATTIMRSLRKRGVRWSIDRFGSGYSSLSCLRRLPVDRIKIDRTFVADMTLDTGAAAVVRTIVGLARNFGLEVVAEGVDEEPQRRFLIENGCDQGQGVLFGGPAPLERLARQWKSMD
jgi:diguanylate cyclase (GGDEF)-like protein/PAS domain S-box-containing protein